VRDFLVFMVECTMFTNKSNKNINLIWLDAMQDLDMIHKSSWGWNGTSLSVPLSIYGYQFHKDIHWHLHDITRGSNLFHFYLCCRSYYNMLIYMCSFAFSDMAFRAFETLIYMVS